MILITNIKQLLQIRDSDEAVVKGAAMKQLPAIDNAWLLIKGDKIDSFGTMSDLPELGTVKKIDATDAYVLPTWCDSHTHLVYAGNREGEFVQRINGASYQEIAASGGGILNSAKKLQITSPEDLYLQSSERLKEVMRLGTGAIEIKSGYGLTLEAEAKMLRVAQELGENFPVAIKTTFLGAHALPQNFETSASYVAHVIQEILPKIAREELADYIDVFCEEGYFSVADMEQLLSAAKTYGLRPKVHVNQFNAIGGIAAAVKHDALSVDHLEVLNPEDIDALKGSDTIPVALPGCSYFLSIPYTPSRQLIDAGLPLAIATDYNPGSAPNGNMNFVVAAACIKMRLTPEEAINAATINGAYAMGLEKTHGSITKGKAGSVIITKKMPSIGFMPYAFGSNMIDKVIINGTEI
ncbi:MAG: imidazolonepropionase [Gilvibacter sp.]